jgi:ankyrin repeat protein
LAAWKGHTLVVEQLIAAGAGLDLKSKSGYEPIYPTATAVRCPSRQPRFVGRYTALINAAGEGHTDIIAALIFAGADVDVSNNVGYGTHRRGCINAVAQALERTSPGQGDCGGRLRSRRQVGGVR